MIKRSVVFLFFIWQTGVAVAGTVSGIPDLLGDNPSLTVPQAVLGRSCYSLEASYLDLDCNPAFLASEKKHLFRINLIGNDQLNVLNQYRLKIEDKNVVGVADSLLGQNTPLVGKAAASIWYQNDWWAVGYVPFRAGVAYLTTNSAFPQISVLAYKESEIFGKVGLYSSGDKHFQLGLQTRYVSRDYVYQQFDALDAFVDSSIVNIQHQSVLYLEPGLVYSWDDEWNPKIAWSLSNVPVIQSGTPVPGLITSDIGFSSDIAGWREMRSTIHLAVGSEYQDLFHRFSWSSIYHIDKIASASITFGIDQISLGVEGHWGPLVAGLSFRNEQVTASQWQAYNVSGFTFEVGLIL